MKKYLLIAAAALVMTSANAQLKTPAVHSKAGVTKEKIAKLPAQRQLDLSTMSTTREMKTDFTTGKPMMTPMKAPKKAGYLEPFYKRPAGMYVSPFHANNGEGLWSYGNLVFLMAKPFADYPFEGTIEGQIDENTHAEWDVFIRDETYYLDDTYGFLYNSYWWLDKAPIFYAVDGDLESDDAIWYSYQIKGFETEEQVGGGVTIKSEVPAEILTADNDETIAQMFGTEGQEFMYSSKTMVPGGRKGDKVGMLTRYYGATPWENNEYGWWFGKNASHVDGMAMCFEKPEHPYLLKNVYLQAAYNDGDFIGMVVNAPVKMKCKVYRLDKIPEYILDEHTTATLPEVPGELIVTGEATVTPTTGEANNGLITFTLYGQDELDSTLTYEYHPTIDFPIMVCIDGYNDPGMEDLVEFSAFVSTDDQADEGYGELCYLKEGIFEVEYDENGDTIFDEETGRPKTYFTGEYYWEGMNNRFSAGDDEDRTRRAQMLTGLSIFIGTENPFITFNHGLEDGEYTFPVEGGSFNKTFEYSDQTITDDAIQFFSMTPSEDGDWWMTYNGSDELPDWLEINLSDNYDEETGEFSGLVLADVVAAPLPAGVKYREAVIRFEIPGDYIEYKFMQGEQSPFIKGDVNGDGEVNIADVNCLIDVILGVRTADEFEGRALVNDDDEVNIADVNAVIDIILGF